MDEEFLHYLTQGNTATNIGPTAKGEINSNKWNGKVLFSQILVFFVYCHLTFAQHFQRPCCNMLRMNISMAIWPVPFSIKLWPCIKHRRNIITSRQPNVDQRMLKIFWRRWLWRKRKILKSKKKQYFKNSADIGLTSGFSWNVHHT